MKKVLHTIIFLFLLTSCTKQKKHTYSHIIIKKDSVSIPLGRTDFYKSLQTHVVTQADGIKLYRESRYTNSIDIFNLYKKSKERTISFKEEGPNGIKGFDGSTFVPVEGDSIFISTLNGRIYHTLRDSVLFHKKQKLRFYGRNEVLPQVYENKIFMYAASDYLQKDQGFKSRPLIGFYDLETNKVNICNIKYPDFFAKNCWSEHHIKVPFTLNNKGQLILSFSVTDDLFVYDIEKDSILSAHSSKSQYAGSVPPYTACDFNDFERYFHYLKSVPLYRSISYDPYKDLYYRIIMIPTDTPPDGKRNQDIVMPMVLMVLDNKFKVIAEKLLPNKTYNPQDFFITKQGFWLSSNSEGSENFNEDQLLFTLFSVKKN